MAIEIDEVITNLLDNADWANEPSLIKAKAFATAASQYLILSPQSSAEPGGFSMTMSVAQIENMLNKAQSFIASNASATNGGSSVQILGAKHGFR